MSDGKQQSVTVSLLRDAYDRVFLQNWPAWLGGVLIGIVSVIVFAWARPWGVVAGLREWIDWLFYGIGLYDSHPAENPLKSWASVLTLGLIWGAFGSALLSRQFAIKVPPPFEMLRSVFGGILMGIGSAMAAGCNVGGFFSATSAMSLGGLAMMAGLIIGALLETRYFYWEIQHLRFKRGEGQPRRPKDGARDRKHLQPYGGLMVVGALFAAVLIYRALGIDESGYDYTITGGLLLAGAAFGIIVHRSRFAFLQGFREPFISGKADQARGMAIAVIISVLGFAALKYTGLRFEGDYVAPTFWVGGFVGGLIFGFGMPFAGGCASGTCWRTAEGSIKVIIALLFMGMFNSFTALALEKSETLRSAMGSSVFLPEHISYLWTVIIIVAIMLAYYLVMSWNEKTQKFI